jgi:hypothetical protein
MNELRINLPQIIVRFSEKSCNGQETFHRTNTAFKAKEKIS